MLGHRRGIIRRGFYRGFYGRFYGGFIAESQAATVLACLADGPALEPGGYYNVAASMAIRTDPGVCPLLCQSSDAVQRPPPRRLVVFPGSGVGVHSPCENHHDNNQNPQQQYPSHRASSPHVRDLTTWSRKKNHHMIRLSPAASTREATFFVAVLARLPDNTHARWGHVSAMAEVRAG